jgi:hypothetical protein
VTTFVTGKLDEIVGRPTFEVRRIEMGKGLSPKWRGVLNPIAMNIPGTPTHISLWYDIYEYARNAQYFLNVSSGTYDARALPTQDVDDAFKTDLDATRTHPPVQEQK